MQKYYKLITVMLFIILSDNVIASSHSYDDKIINYLKSANNTIFIQEYGFTSDKLIDSLIELKKKGLDVQIIFDSDISLLKSNKLKVQKLHDAGVIIYQDKLSDIKDRKIIIIDNNIVITNISIINDLEIVKCYLKNWENRNKVIIK